MTNECTPCKHEDKKMVMGHHGGSSDTVYALGLIGAWAYYFKRATTLREGVLGFFKGIVWPAFFVYELLKLLNGESYRDSDQQAGNEPKLVIPS